MRLRTKLAALGIATSAGVLTIRALRSWLVEPGEQSDRRETRTEVKLRVIDGALADAKWLDDEAA